MGIEIRAKRDHGGAPMHLKSYQIDGRLLRAGAVNLSAFGLKCQDNDLVLRGRRRGGVQARLRCAIRKRGSSGADISTSQMKSSGRALADVV